MIQIYMYICIIFSSVFASILCWHLKHLSWNNMQVTKLISLCGFDTIGHFSIILILIFFLDPLNIWMGEELSFIQNDQ